MGSKIKIGLAPGLWLFIVISSSFAQQSETPLKSPEKLFLHDFVTDQRSIWTSPKHLKGQDLRWLVPFVSVGAVLIAEDNHIAKSLTYSPNQLLISHRFSDVGVDFMYGTVGVLYLGGRLTHRERSMKTGLLGAEALAGGTVVIRLLKFATDRKRPFAPEGTGFRAGGESFPSGHSFSAWTVAAVLSNRYPQKWIKFGSYGLASGVSIARCTGKNHYPADVLVGGVVGYLIGHHVSHR
jgi:membrane-associated phospholipid phosphatase